MIGLKDKIKDLSYTALESLTRGSGLARDIGGVSVRFPARYARYYEQNYEPVTFDFLRRSCEPGGTYLDCGAHIGLFAVVGARLVGEAGKVFSFEPTPKTRRILEEVVRINRVGSVVEVRGEAISEASGTATFYDTGDDASNANSLVQTARHADGLTVQTVSIDDFVAERDLKINALKIDVEGAELGALRGARATFETQLPPLSLGLHPNAIVKMGATLEEIWDLLREFPYRITCEGKAIEKDRFVAQTDLFDVQCYPQTAAQP